jgi:hypothetical protein
MGKEKTNPAFLQIEDVTDLIKNNSLDGMLIKFTEGGAETIDIDEFAQILQKIAKPISPGDLAPTAEGWYKPTVYSDDPGTNYPNHGNLKAVEGFETMFYFDGSTWKSYANKMPKASQNIRLWEDFTSADFPLPGKTQTIKDNVQYLLPEGVTADVGDVPGISDKWVNIGARVSDEFNPNSEKEAQGGKQIADALSDVKVFKDVLIPFTKTQGKFILQGQPVDAASYEFSNFTPILHTSFAYKTELNTNVPEVAIYDGDFILLDSKNAIEMTNTSTGYVERNLADDFDLTVAKYARISNFPGVFNQQIEIFYKNSFLKDNTTPLLDFNSIKAIRSEAVKPLLQDIENQNIQIKSLNKKLEEITPSVKYMESATSFARGCFGAQNFGNTTYSILSRDSDYQMTTSFTGLNNYGAVVVFTGSKHIVIRLLKTASGVMTTADKLPTTIVNFQWLWADAFHYSRYGCKAFGEWIVDNALQDRVQIKDRPFKLYSYDETFQNNSPNFVRAGEIILKMDRLPNTFTGGWLDQPNGLLYNCEVSSPTSQNRISSKYPNYYIVTQNVAGAGVEFNIPSNVDGYIRIVLGTEYKESVITGKINLKAFDKNNQVFYNRDLIEHGLNEILIPISSNKGDSRLKISLLNDLTTVFTISQIEVVETYLEQVSIFENGVTIASLGDSLWQFPLVGSGETEAFRYDGSGLNGLGFVRDRVSEYLTTLGISNTFYNCGKGGMTSAWGLYNVRKILDTLPIKPDIMFVSFMANDSNSQENVANQTPSNWDFSPTSIWEIKRSDEGGVFGSTNRQQWLNNMQQICKIIQDRGITPIVIGMQQYSSDISISMEKMNVKFLKEFKF